MMQWGLRYDVRKDPVQVFAWVTDHLRAEWPTKILQSGPRKGQEVILDEAKDIADAWVVAKAGYVSSL